jgi:hypothetical protein
MMWLANEYDEWKKKRKRERERRENVLSDGRLNVEEGERTNPLFVLF